MAEETKKEIEIVADDGGEIGVIQGEKEVHPKVWNPEVQSLYGLYKRGKLILQPEFQRMFVWDTKKASWLIESALQNLPLPIFYFAKEEDGSVSVIDGQQRLTSFFSFIDGEFPNGNQFRLNNLKLFSDLNKKSFKQLGDELQDKIQGFNVSAVEFPYIGERDFKFLMFERLNSGATALNSQELRNCIFRGPYNKLLRELSQDPKYAKLAGFAQPHKRMGDVELVLRFAAFYFQGYENYRPPMKTFLNDEMERRRNISPKEAAKLKTAFSKAVSLTASLLGSDAFTRFVPGDSETHDGGWESGKLNASLHDALMFGFSHPDIQKNLVMANLDAIKEELIHLMVDDEKFSDSIQRGTSEGRKVRLRLGQWLDSLRGILGDKKRQPRLFKREFKEVLYKNNPTCALCGNHIAEIDDAAVDHIEQYWRGGKTIPENARLAHRYCNSARSRND